jgi:3-oxoacyl-[acyl-carrier-protein] synthase II
METKRVAITGLGLVTGLGLDLESCWRGLLAGPSAVKRFTLFDPSGLTTPFGIELPAGAEELFKASINPRRRKQMTRATEISVVAAHMALANSGLPDLPGLDRTRVGVVAGATGTGYAPRTLDVDNQRILKNMASASAAWISLQEKLQGPSLVVSTACSSGAYALSQAYSLVVSGQCDAVVAGAGDSALNYLDVEGFCNLMALSQDTENMLTASRPFDANRNGFVIAEGGGFLVVESLEHARQRGARVLVEMSQPGLSCDAYNMLSPEPSGESMSRAMSLAIAKAGISPGQLDYVNAHGTSTPLNDLYETQALKRLLGGAARNVPVSSTKSMTGHCLSAAAGVEAVICCQAMLTGIIPPTMNLQTPDPELDLDYVPNEPRRRELAHVMSNSFAFGGQNAVCLFSKPE